MSPKVLGFPDIPCPFSLPLHNSIMFWVPIPLQSPGGQTPKAKRCWSIRCPQEGAFLDDVLHHELVGSSGKVSAQSLLLQHKEMQEEFGLMGLTKLALGDNRSYRQGKGQSSSEAL